MQITSRFTVAAHICTAIAVFRDRKVTSEFLAASVNANPVVIRRVLQQLKAAGIVTVQRGSGGASFARPADQITLLDLYRAVEPVEDGSLFHFHEDPNGLCPVGRNIHRIMDGRLQAAQKAMEEELEKTTVADLSRDAGQLIAQEETE